MWCGYLQANDVWVVGKDLVQHLQLAILPRKVPRGHVAVGLRAGVFFCKDVVGQERERACN